MLHFGEFFTKFFNLACSNCRNGIFPKILVIPLARLIDALSLNALPQKILVAHEGLNQEDRNFLKCLGTVLFLKVYTSNFTKRFRRKKLFWKFFTLLEQLYANYPINWELGSGWFDIPIASRGYALPCI